MMRIARLLAAGFLLAALTGCGVGEYERRMEPKLKELAWAAQFGDLKRTPDSIPGTPFAIRLPASFRDRPTTADSPSPTGTGTVGEESLQSPMPAVKLPGIRVYFQAAAQVEGTNVPYCCHAAVVAPDEASGAAPAPQPANTNDAAKKDEAPSEPKPLADQLAEQIKAAVPDADVTWEVVSCETPVMGQRIEWKRLRVPCTVGIGIQEVLRQKGPGQIHLYLLEKDGYQVMLLWRMLDRTSGAVNLDEMGRRVAGTITGP